MINSDDCSNGDPKGWKRESALRRAVRRTIGPMVVSADREERYVGSSTRVLRLLRNYLCMTLVNLREGIRLDSVL